MRKLLIAFILSAVIVALLATFLVITPSSAFSPPNQGSDNATDVILWHGDNSTITIASANITIVDLETALTNAINEGADQIADEMGVIASAFFALMLILCLAYFGLFSNNGKGDRILCITAGLAFIIFGFTQWTVIRYLSIVLVISGFGMFIKAWVGRAE